MLTHLAAAAMIREFARREAAFNNWTLPADPQSIGVSPERLAEYRKLLRAAGTPRGFQRSPAREGFNFFFWLQGSAISDDAT
jgi:hypothetical protein